MTRTILTLAAFVGFSVWASAQNQTPAFHTQLKQFEENRVLLDQLIDVGLNLSSDDKGGNSLARAEECRLAVVRLADALNAAPHSDPERVAELSDVIVAMVQDGLIPNLNQAGQDIKPGSQDYEKLSKISERSNTDVAGFVAAFPKGDQLDQSQKVIDARTRLADAGRKIIVIK